MQISLRERNGDTMLPERIVYGVIQIAENLPAEKGSDNPNQQLEIEGGIPEADEPDPGSGLVYDLRMVFGHLQQ